MVKYNHFIMIPCVHILCTWALTKVYPDTLTACRPWQYNDSINEYYVITADQTKLEKKETTRQTEETELEDA